MAVIAIDALGRDILPGDMLVVRNDLKADRRYNHVAWDIYCTYEMTYYRGNVATVRCSDREEILIDLDDGEWCWAKDMFEGIVIPDELEDITDCEVPSLDVLFA